jgi:hypothetical protein
LRRRNCRVSESVKLSLELDDVFTRIALLSVGICESLANLEASQIVLFREIDLPLFLCNFAELPEDLR